MTNMEREDATLERERVASMLMLRAWAGLASHLSGKRFAAPRLVMLVDALLMEIEIELETMMVGRMRDIQ